MDERLDPTTAMDNEDTVTAEGAIDESGDDDLLGAIGLDLGGDETPPAGTSIDEAVENVAESAYEAARMGASYAREDVEDLDPYQIGANVAAMVRQLVSERLDRIITVAVEQAVAKELRRIKGKVE